MEALSTTAAVTGRLPDRQATHKHKESIGNGDWMGLLGLAVTITCFDENREQTFEDRRQDLLKADLSQFARPAEALAHMRQLLQAANTAYGSDFITTYDRYKLIKTNWPNSNA